MRVLPLVLILSAAPAYAAVPHYVCRTIQPGDTAARVAQRLTGDARNRYEPWFQIFDPATRAIQPKSEYDLILPGWKVCLPKEMIRDGLPLEQNQIVAVAIPAQPVHARPEGVTSGQSPLPWFAASLLMAIGASVVIRRDLERQRVIRARMKQLGDEFIREFERPLLRQPCLGHPIRARLRLIPRRGRLDVLLAPNERRTYPNLSDHRKNLEYDVERVLQALGEELSVSGKPYARGPWVVIPFQLKAG
jgi:hypothetical protein